MKRERRTHDELEKLFSSKRSFEGGNGFEMAKPIRLLIVINKLVGKAREHVTR